MFTQRESTSFFPMQVVDLIDPTTRTWHRDLVEKAFWPIDCVRIFSIPIGDINSNDRWVWHYSKDGNFSIKSAYQLRLSEVGSEESTSCGAMSGTQSGKWSDIWKLNLPPQNPTVHLEGLQKYFTICDGASETSHLDESFLRALWDNSRDIGACFHGMSGIIRDLVATTFSSAELGGLRSGMAIVFKDEGGAAS